MSASTAIIARPKKAPLAQFWKYNRKAPVNKVHGIASHFGTFNFALKRDPGVSPSMTTVTFIVHPFKQIVQAGARARVMHCGQFSVEDFVEIQKDREIDEFHAVDKETVCTLFLMETV